MHYFIQKLSLALLILMSLTSLTHAQTIIKGAVMSVSQAVSDASVELSAQSLGKKYQVKTNAQGTFQVEVLNDQYQITVSKAGYLSEKLSINAQGKEIYVNIELQAQNQQSRSKAEAEKAAAPVSEAPQERAYKSKGFGSLGVKGVGVGGGGLGRSGIAHTMPSPRMMIAQTPMPVEENRDEFKHINENGFFDASSSPLSTFSIDVDTASYSNVRSYLEKGSKPSVDAIKVEEFINYFDYQYPAPKEGDAHPFSIYTELSSTPWNPKHKLLHIGLQGLKIDKSKLPQSNIVFLIDVSGSMNAPNKLPLLKQAFALLVENLNEKDKVSIVVYAGAAGLVLPPTSASDKATIMNALSQLQAGGSTAGGAGIELAYQVAMKNKIADGNNRVILATDGDFNVGASSESDLIRLIEEKRKSGIFLTVLGFGMGNYKDNKMSVLAEKGNGNHAYIDSLFEAKKVLVQEMGGTLLTIAKDVKIQVEFNPLKVAQYRLIGYESRVLANKDFNDDSKDAGELGAGHSVTALYEIIAVDPATSAKPQVDELKYQKKPETIDSDEWVNVKFRYKKPKEDQSILLSQAHKGESKWDDSSSDFKFSSAVAMFAMVLAESKYAGAGNYELVRKIASQSLNQDSYRMDFLEIVKKAMLLKK